MAKKAETPAVSAVERELCEAAGGKITRKDGEKYSSYVKRLLSAVDVQADASEAVWESLSESAQAFFAKAAAANKKGKEPPAFATWVFTPPAKGAASEESDDAEADEADAPEEDDPAPELKKESRVSKKDAVAAKKTNGAVKAKPAKEKAVKAKAAKTTPGESKKFPGTKTVSPEWKKVFAAINGVDGGMPVRDIIKACKKAGVGAYYKRFLFGGLLATTTRGVYTVTSAGRKAVGLE